MLEQRRKNKNKNCDKNEKYLKMKMKVKLIFMWKVKATIKHYLNLLVEYYFIYFTAQKVNRLMKKTY